MHFRFNFINIDFLLEQYNADSNAQVHPNVFPINRIFITLTLLMDASKTQTGLVGSWQNL